ncbi:MAG: transporter substrate-binding domain-containing protein [Faecalibacterium sp.]|jgi:polar amino acid transport system substrate-binding protein|nr:transporter substrate-binding domain-containing protein [Faecalibacterium sp.]
MKKISRRSFLMIAGAAAAAGALSACGAASSAPASSAASSGAAASAAGTDKKWIIATDTVFVPFEYTDETGAFVGIDVDLLAAIAADQGFQYDLQSIGWDGAVAAVQSGQADAIIAGASIKQERIDSGWMFSDGYFTATQTVAVPSDSKVASFDDLKGAHVAVKNGTAGADYAESLKEQYSLDIAKFDDSPTMYQDVLSGNSAACFEDTPVMAAYIKQHDLALKIPDGMENDGSPYGFAIMNKDNQPLLDLFNAGLKNIQDSGKYDEIIAKYLG